MRYKHLLAIVAILTLAVGCTQIAALEYLTSEDVSIAVDTDNDELVISKPARAQCFWLQRLVDDGWNTVGAVPAPGDMWFDLDREFSNPGCDDEGFEPATEWRAPLGELPPGYYQLWWIGAYDFGLGGEVYTNSIEFE